MPPPTSFLYFTSARSGSTPMVPVGASTVTCALRYPLRSPSERASSQHCLLPSSTAAGTFSLLILFTEARCIRITSRNGSRLLYQPGHAPPVTSCGETLEE